MTNQNVMNDQYGMEDLLEQEKYLIHSYSDFIPEATEPQLRQVLNQNFTDCVNDQFSVFTKMDQLGWFEGQTAQQPQVDKARQRFSQMMNQLNG